jgi:hypothetical protein
MVIKDVFRYKLCLNLSNKSQANNVALDRLSSQVQTKKKNHAKLPNHRKQGHAHKSSLQ